MIGVCLAACASGAPSNTGGVTPPTATNTTWMLVWSDEFDGVAGATFERAKWVADTGGAGWGNQEREFYTTRTENIALDGNGHLVITARAEPASSPYSCWYGHCSHTSARIKTKGLVTQAYGRFEARIRLSDSEILAGLLVVAGRTEHPRETITFHYERDPDDPRIGHTLTLAVDDYGRGTFDSNVTRCYLLAFRI